MNVILPRNHFPQDTLSGSLQTQRTYSSVKVLVIITPRRRLRNNHVVSPALASLPHPASATASARVSQGDEFLVSLREAFSRPNVAGAYLRSSE